MSNLPTLTRNTRKLYEGTVMPSLQRIFRKTATLDTDYEHPTQLGAKIADLLCRRTIEGTVVTETELRIVYVLHKGTSSDPRWRAYISDIRSALDADPNTSLSVVGNHKSGWSIK